MNQNEQDLIHLLTPYDIGSRKKRLGPNRDGGYVIAEIALEKCESLFTYGVGGNIGYEKDFVNLYTNKKAYLFDHTITGINSNNKSLLYYHEGLGFEENCADFIDHYNNLEIVGDVLLKIDIEKNEYDYFEKTDIERLGQITSGIILEVHSINDEKNRLINMINSLNKYFILNHIHPNNCKRTRWNYGSYSLPTLLELSFVNRKYVSEYSVDNSVYPIEGLDHPNCPKREDIKLIL